VRNAKYFGLAILTVAVVAGVSAFRAADEPKYKIKDVMKKCMAGKDALCKKVAMGKGTDEDKKTLVEYFTALSQNKPPKGEEASWKTKTKALVDAATEVAKGTEGADKKLSMAANCMACHAAHRPPAN
jgi:hypothetical protein